MSVHYKFKSSLDFDTITFDGLHISVNDFRKAVIQQKRLGKTNDFELQITNAQTKEEYQNDNDLIPKNTSLIISRIPQTSKKSRDTSQPQNTPVVCHVPKYDSNALDLSQMNASEEDKIQAMMAQSTVDYDPRGYQKIRGPGQTGEVPPTYRCYKCHQTGHWIKNCPLPHSSAKKSEIRRNTGIPKSFLHEKGAENEEMAEEIVIPEKQAEVPEDLLCSICKDIFRDAVMIPCCGSSFCDDCVRTALLESEENECPDCNEKGTSPESLIPNRFLRSSVNTFKNETGYERRRKNNGVHEVASVAAEIVVEKKENEKEKGKEKENEQEKQKDNDNEKEKEKEEEKEQEIATEVHEQLMEDEISKPKKSDSPPPKLSPSKENHSSPKREDIKETAAVEKEKGKEEHHKEFSPELNSPKKHVEVVIPQHNSDAHQRGEESFKHSNPSSYPNYGHPDMQHRSNTSDSYPVRSDSYMRHAKHNQGIVPPPMGYCNNYGNRTERYYYPRDSYNINAAPYPYAQNPRCRQMVPHSNIQPYYQGMSGPMETGIIEDPLEAFNRIMKEKEKRKEMKRLATERSERSERHRPVIIKRGTRESSPLVEKRTRHRGSPSNERRNRSPLRQEKPSSHRNMEREKNMRSHRNHYSGNNRSFSRSNSPPQRRFSKSPIRRRSRSRSHPRSHSREMELLRHDNRHPKHVLQQSHRIDYEKEMVRYNKRPPGRFSETRSLSETGPKENRRHNSKLRENGNQMFENYAPPGSRKMFFETEIIPENREVPYEFYHDRRSKASMCRFEDGPRVERRNRDNHDERRQSLHPPGEEPPKIETEKRSKERKKKKEKEEKVEKTEKKSKKDKKEKRKRERERDRDKERHKDEPKKQQEHKKSRRDTDSMANANEKDGEGSRSRTKGSNDESMDDKAETFTPDININRNLDDDKFVDHVQREVRKEIKNPFKTERSPQLYKNERCKQIIENNGSELNTPTSFVDTTPENYAGKWDNFDFSMPNSEEVRRDNDRESEYSSHLFQNSSPTVRSEQFGMNRHFRKNKDSYSRSHQHEGRRTRNEQTLEVNRPDLTTKSISRRASPTPSEGASSSSSKTPQSKKRRKKSKHKKDKSSKRSSSAESSRKSSSKHKKSRTEKKKKSKRNESR